MAFCMREIDGRPLLFSEKLERLGVPHAFGTRLGGASRGDLAGANMSFFNGDQRRDVVSNWQGLLSRCGLAGASLHVLRQVHGTQVVPVEPVERPEDFHHQGSGDGLTTCHPGQALGVITADCIPVLVAFVEDEHGPAQVAALHSGWRGSVAGILPGFLRAAGRPPEAVALGPHIRREYFQVGPEVLADFEAAFEAVGGVPEGAIRAGEGDRLLVDLEALLLLQLEACGVPRERIDAGAPCTYSQPDLFFSYRRDGPGKGLLGHTIGLPQGRLGPVPGPSGGEAR